ncbi:MAG: hypothetical protein HOW73_09545 [Polyangiaceae bacterium]|nr:hypothetical protein [Polyangiaceae bacterium]
MKHRTLLTAGISFAAGAIAFVSAADAMAMCFWSNGERPWTDGTYIYEFDESADNPVTACGLANNLTPAQLAQYINPDTQQYYTVRELFLEGLADWLEDPDFPVGLVPQEYTGAEPERVVVTSFCDPESNHHKEEYVEGYGVVRHLNLRPTTHTKAQFHRTVRHETGHSFGMAHMHNRWDRDAYVTIHPEDITNDEMQDYTGVLSVGACNGINLMLPYDISSIMHYIPPPKSKKTNKPCNINDISGCTITPGSPNQADPDYNPDFASDFATMQNALQISILDRRALQLYYPLQDPDRPGVYNPESSLWSFLHMNQGVIASQSEWSRIYTSDTYLGVAHRAIYGEGNPTARPLVAPWDEHSFDRLGEGYYPGGRTPFTFFGDGNESGDEADDPHGELYAYSFSKLVTVDTADGVQVVAYVPGMDIALYDTDGDGLDDHVGAPPLCGLFDPSEDDEPFSGDFDGDGLRTLAVREATTGMVHIDLDGDMIFDTWTTPWFPDDELRPFAGDWNGDGRDDIGAFNPLTRTVYLDRDGTGGIEFIQYVSSDAVFTVDGYAPQPDDGKLWPFAGHFGRMTVRDDIFNTFPWDLPHCEVMSDELEHCMQPWEWCEDLGAASNGCYDGVVCGEYIDVGYKDWEPPPGCAYVDEGWGVQFQCNLNPDCTVPGEP